MSGTHQSQRASELRGLRWSNVDLHKKELHVGQRADRYHVIRKPKTEAGERTVPLPPTLVCILREWRLGGAALRPTWTLCFQTVTARSKQLQHYRTRSKADVDCSGCHIPCS
jgi:integrase